MTLVPGLFLRHDPANAISHDDNALPLYTEQVEASGGKDRFGSHEKLALVGDKLSLQVSKIVRAIIATRLTILASQKMLKSYRRQTSIFLPAWSSRWSLRSQRLLIAPAVTRPASQLQKRERKADRLA